MIQIAFETVVTLRLHGYPAIALAGLRKPLRLKHGLALLAYLALQPHRVGRATLATLLWPEAGPGIARTRLRRLVHSVHERVGRVLVQGDQDALWLATDVGSDLQHTEAVVARLQRGDPLPADELALLARAQASDVLAGFSLGSEAFDDWLDERRRVQHARLAQALERATELGLACHDATLVQSLAIALLRLEPCAESGHIARIAARALHGDAAGVEAAYFDCADRLRREFGKRPSARIEAAYARALDALRAPGHGGPGAFSHGPPAAWAAAPHGAHGGARLAA